MPYCNIKSLPRLDHTQLSATPVHCDGSVMVPEYTVVCTTVLHIAACTVQT
jgi:hypothetical protein